MADDNDRAVKDKGSAGTGDRPAKRTDDRTRDLDATGAPGAPASTPFTQQVGRVVMIVAAVLFGVFAVANVDAVTFNWIFGEGDVPLILLLLVSFGLGALVAWIAATRKHRRR
ncbi:MAG: LapA family protein [Nitriliruptorales bacterium]|nr:LapA family protein [Nitriliruptorales bacterium]